MVICKICNVEFKSIKSLTSHLVKHTMTSKQYYNAYIKKSNEELCSNCNGLTNFKSIREGYFKYCSLKCSSSSSSVKEKIKKTNIKKYGVDNPLKNKDIRKKMKQTNIKKYGVENVSQNIFVKKKKIETARKNYSTDYHLQNEEIKEKIKQTCVKKYGVACILQNEEIKEKIKQTCVKKYGTNSPLKNKDIRERIKQTNIKRYGCSFVFNNMIVQKKIKQTNIKRYGTVNPSKNKDIKEKVKKTNLKRYGTTSPSKNKDIKEKSKESYLKKFNIKVSNLLGSLSLKKLNIYKGSRDIIKVSCFKCGTVFNTIYFNLYQGCSKCPNCYPKYKSNAETDILNFIKSLEFEIVVNSRTVIPPYELDIYIPDKKIAIEYNGLYWHSEAQGKDKNYHLNKTEKCLNKGIQLIQIFEDEWLFKQDIVKNRLRQILGVSTSKKIYARKCKIKEVLPKVKNEFLSTYHIQGKDNSSIKLGAYYGEELVAIMTFAKGNIAKGSKAKEGVWELKRYCSNSNCRVIGIASKLLKHFQRNYEWSEIFSYADRRWSSGNLYKVLGFELDSITKPNYWYIKYQQRIHRFSLRKRPEESKDIPEWVLRDKEGYLRIWDCGHLKFSLVR